MTNKKKNDLPVLTRRRAAILFQDDSGAATAEYAITTMAAVAFAGLLVVIRRALRTSRPTPSAQ
ncbi:MAG TPA: DUF4244 domain-containing protein [Microbacterium sp.]|nr:DUF4244 domain-containing protein [Microbacterium sp.]